MADAPNVKESTENVLEAFAIKSAVIGLSALIEIDYAIQRGELNNEDPEFLNGAQFVINSVHEACASSMGESIGEAIEDSNENSA